MIGLVSLKPSGPWPVQPTLGLLTSCVYPKLFIVFVLYSLPCRMTWRSGQSRLLLSSSVHVNIWPSTEIGDDQWPEKQNVTGYFLAPAIPKVPNHTTPWTMGWTSFPVLWAIYPEKLWSEKAWNRLVQHIWTHSRPNKRETTGYNGTEHTHSRPNKREKEKKKIKENK